jgi:hypothetical protein
MALPVLPACGNATPRLFNAFVQILVRQDCSVLYHVGFQDGLPKHVEPAPALVIRRSLDLAKGLVIVNAEGGSLIDIR